MADPNRSGGLGANASVIHKIARDFRRVRGNETPKPDGSRIIWHRGPMQTELTTWEQREDQIQRQELTFCGLLVELKHDALHTGRVNTDSETEKSRGISHGAALIRDKQLAGETLRLASQLLKGMPQRDYYAQHMLKFVNEALVELDNDSTAVSRLQTFSKMSPHGRISSRKTHPAGSGLASPRAWLLLALAATAILIGFLVART